VRTKPCLTAADVKKMLAAAEELAVQNQWPLAIAVLDDGGHTLGLLRLDGANAANTDLALAKARASAITRMPSRFWADRLKAGQLLMLTLPHTAPQGGLPVMVNGECVGAIACSGAKAEDDERAAQAGIDALGIEP
jgi:uncharacterized protein GlcG (DUF336 family)